MSTIDMTTIKNIEDVILFQIDRTSKISKIYSQREFDSKKIGITVDQWILLKIIAESTSLSQKELADKSLRDPASITRSLDILTKKSLVLRVAIPNNRRKYDIVLTEAGQKFVKKHMNMITRHRQKSTEGLTKKELTTLVGLLKKIQNNLS